MSSQLESELAHADILYPELVREVKRLRAREAALVAALQQIEDRLSAWQDGAMVAAKAADRRRDLSEETAHLNRAENYGTLIQAARAALAGQED